MKMFHSWSLCSDVDKVHDLMDDVSEQQELANEISEAISNPVGFGQEVDEVQIKRELCATNGVSQLINYRVFSGRSSC